MSQTLFKKHLLESLKYGFIDREQKLSNQYSPKIVINNPSEKQFVLTDIQEELQKSVAFYFSVAFVTKSGIAMIKSQLSDLSDKNVHGKILISPYLDFNDPDAMRELLKLKNVEVRMTSPELKMHSKYYLFEQRGRQVLISGSANLTGGALKVNYEWNIKLMSADTGDFISKTKQEFDRIWGVSVPLTEDTIQTYSSKRQNVIRLDTIKDSTAEYHTRKIVPNMMQKEALSGISSIRAQQEKKALVISSTGTGKTYLAAFDVQQYNPDKMLFIVHRKQILSKALKSFQEVIGFQDNQACIYEPGMDLTGKQYIFATIQTLSRDEHLSKFDKSFFDYILIDEVHKAGAGTYKKLMNYFEPEFFLGMTATPERTDGQNIYELFDYNIAYEIRLQKALDNDLLCPFIYFGVTDITLNGQLISESEDFRYLVSEERVKHILDKIDYYGYSGDSVKGLVFCSSKKEARELSIQFNLRGFKTVALTGEDSNEKREIAVKQLELGELDYLFTVDIFNEGIDIPSVNQVVMLRNTESSIVFIQQLGRGLRKHDSKEFVTIIDFIGNYQNNYLIPIALFGDQSMNKDNYRKEMRESHALQGLTTVNFEEIAKEQIFKSIANTSLSQMKILRDAFQDLRNRLGRIPYLEDYIKHNSIDPIVFFQNSKFKNYSDVINQFADDKITLIDTEIRYLNFITFELMDGKRSHELILLKLLLENEGVISKQVYLEYLSKHNFVDSQDIIRSVENVLNLSFLKKQERNKFGEEPLVYLSDNKYQLHNTIKQSIQRNCDFRKLFLDIVTTGLLKSTQYPDIFTIGEKYTRRDVLKLLNFAKDEPPLNIGGYKIDHDTNTCPIFLTYHKKEDISDTIKYEDELLNESTLLYFSKNKRTLKSPDVLAMTDTRNGMRKELFVMKDDSESGEFYYLGELTYIEDSADEMTKNGESVVSMLFKLNQPVKPDLFNYLTKK